MPQLKEARSEGKIDYFRHTNLIVNERYNTESVAGAVGGADEEMTRICGAGVRSAGERYVITRTPSCRVSCHGRYKTLPPKTNKWPEEPDSYRTLQAVKEHVHEETRNIKRKKWLEWCSTLDARTSVGQMWRSINSFAKGKPPKITPHRDPSRAAEELAIKFADRASSNQLPITTRATLQDLTTARWEEIEEAINTEDETDAPFSLTELLR
ncbi:hypothetical protein SK128_002099, partial [Halocaridina rubra]